MKKMSQWTHLAGIIRIDNYTQAIRLPNKQPITAEDILARAKQNMPSGSEGPIKMHVHVWPTAGVDDFDWNCVDIISDGSIYWGDLIISGDLRNIGGEPDDVPNIVKWFKELVSGIDDDMGGLHVRQAVIQIEPESLDRTMVCYDTNPETWVEHNWKLQ